MEDLAERAQRELELASDDAESNISEQLHSVDEGFGEIVAGDKTKEGHTHLDRLRELEEKLDGLAAEAEGAARDHIEAARRLIRDYRDRLSSRE